MRKWLFGAGVILCLGAGGAAAWQKLKSDRTGPEITIAGELIYQDGMEEEELLQGVTAWDEQDGDVTDSLVVETVTVDTADGTAVIYYAARDGENNVGKVRRNVVYDPTGLAVPTGENGDTEDDQETGTRQALSVSGDPAAPLAGINAERQDSRGNLTDSEEESEEMTETEPESESEDLDPWQPVLRLSSLSATIQAGDTFDPLSYVASITDDYDNIYALWRDIQVEGEYDTTEAGTYELTYYVIDSSGYSSNRARFLLRVEED